MKSQHTESSDGSRVRKRPFGLAVPLQMFCIPIAGRQPDDLFLTAMISRYLPGRPLPARQREWVGRETALVPPCFLTEPSKQALAADFLRRDAAVVLFREWRAMSEPGFAVFER
jgi:hypothetical protein